jgi:very-short-patch-repair endonuclease
MSDLPGRLSVMGRDECAWPPCSGPVRHARTGRPRSYCSDACRQAACRERGLQARLEAQRAAELAAMAAAVDHVRTAAADTVRRALNGPRAAFELTLAELSAASGQLEHLALGTRAERTRQAPTRLERWLFVALDEAGVAYQQFASAGVGRYVADALLTEHMVIIEVDGVRWHRKRVESDQRRDAKLTAAGYTVVHFTDLEMTSQAKARALVTDLIASIRAGQQGYRPPLLWPGTPA